MRIILNNAKKYKQEANISTLLAPAVAVAPAAPIVLPAHMPEYRMQAIRGTVAARLREGAAQGTTQADVLTTVRHEQDALLAALTNRNFVDTMAATYIAQMTMYKAFPVPSPEQAAVEIGSILKNRIADCRGTVQLLGDPAFLSAAVAEAAQPAAPTKPYSLPPVKQVEMVRRLVQPRDDSGAEPAIHVAATARGQLVTHEALAGLFAPEGLLRAALVHALATAWPQARAAQIEALAANWLNARYEPARATAEALKPGGVVLAEAMRQAEEFQNKKLGITANPVAAAPSPVTAAPRIHAGVIKDAPQANMVMEV